MNFKSIGLFLFGALLVLVSACSSQETNNPQIALSTERIVHTGWVTMKGTGFTPLADVHSHLRRPNGTEFPVLPMMTDAQGEITHEIDTLLLDEGIHELWIVDTATGGVSNTAQFEVTLEQPR